MKPSTLDYVSARSLHAELTAALRANDFILHVQPEVDLASGRIVAAEALIRWDHREWGLLPPSRFVPFAQERGLLSAIGAWVVGEAAAAAARLRAVDPSFRVWFNVWAAEFGDPGWCAQVTGAGGSRRGLGVEITEDVAMRDVPATLRTLAALAGTGLSIALDDFGTGYSSLAQLHRFPIDVVKLDRSFIAGFSDDVRNREIVGAVLRIGRRLGFETVVKGIETVQQARALRDAGCRYGQGYQLGAPIPVDELVALIEQRGLVAS